MSSAKAKPLGTLWEPSDTPVSITRPDGEVVVAKAHVLDIPGTYRAGDQTVEAK